MNDEKRFSDSTPTADGCTPPERQILPLTPPATDDLQSTSNPQSPVSAILDLIKQHQRHKSTAQSQRLEIEPSDFEILLARLEKLPKLKGIVDDKLRLEYDPLEKALYIRRMPTPIHESFLAQVSDETRAQLKRIESGNGEAARFAAQISSVRSGSIYLREFDSDDDIEVDQPYIQRQPDDQFQHEQAEYPGVVYEIACSQDDRSLSKAAWSYILYSNANIKVVVGFDLGYGKNKEARTSVWQPRYLNEGEEGLETLDVEAIIDRDIFRSSDGSATNPTKTIHLPLDCFATSKLATFQNHERLGITITYAQLAEFLEKAERLQQVKQPALGEESIGIKSTERRKKRKRPSTPDRQLSSDRELEFRDAENKAERRTVVEDKDFQGQTRGSMDKPERRPSRRKK